MLGEQNGTWDLEGKFQVTVEECGRKHCSAISRELEAEVQELQKQDFSFNHIAVPTAKTFFMQWACTSDHLALGLSSWHWQFQNKTGRCLLRSLLPKNPCCPTGDEGPVSLLATQHMPLAAEGALLPCVENGTLCMQHLVCSKLTPEPGSPDPVLLESGVAPSLHCGLLTQF